MNRWIEYVAIAAIVAVMAFTITWYNKPEPIPPGVTVEATPSPEVKNEPKVDIKPPVVSVYKPGTKGKLKLPELVVKDPEQHVIASSKTANDERQHTITTVINSSTGETQTFDRVEPLPWVAVNTKTDIGIYAGIKNGEQTIRIEARQELIQVKALHMGAIASADATRAGADGFIGVGVWARW